MSAVLNLEITLDAKGAVSGVKSLDTAIGGLDQKAKQADKSGFDLFATIFKGVTAANIATKAISIMTGFVMDSARGFMEEEVQLSKLNVVLNRNKEDVVSAGKGIENFVQKMTYLTGTDHEQIRALELLARQYGIQNDKINEAIKGAIGLTEIGGSLEGNLKAIANAYGGNFTQLNRLIPEIRNANTDSERMDILQRKMAEGFEMSTAAMKTNAGQIKEMGNELGEMGKNALGAFASVFNFINNNSFLGKMKKEIRETITEQDTFDTALQNFKNKTAPQFKASIEQLGFIDVESDMAAGEAQEKAFEASTKSLTKTIKAHIETMQERYDKEQATAKFEEAYVAFVNAKYIPSAEKILALYDSMPKAQGDWNDQIELGVPLLGAFVEKTDDVAVKTKNDAKVILTSWQEVVAIFEMVDKAMGNVDAMFSALGIDSSGVTKQISNAMGAAQGFQAGLASMNKEGATLGDTLAGVTSIVGAVAAAVTIAIAVIKMFAGDGIGEAIFRETAWMKLNDQLEKQLRELAAAMGDTHAATSQMLDDIIAQSEVNVNNFDMWVGKVREILSDFDRGTFDINKTILEMGDAFEVLIGKAKELGTEGSAGLMVLFDDLNARGIQVKEINDYIAAQLVAGLAGYKAMKAATLESADALAAFGGIGIKVFDDMIAYEKKVAENQGLVDGIEGATAAMIGLSNAQRLTEQQFDDFASAGYIAYQKLEAGGMSDIEAMKTMAPYLQRLQFLHEQYGYTIDDATQKLIDEGIASGTVFENQKSENQQIIDLLGLIAHALGADITSALDLVSGKAIDAFGTATKAAGSLLSVLDEVSKPRSIDISAEFENQKGSVYAASGWHGWVAGGSNEQFTVGDGVGPERVDITPMSQMGSSSWVSPQIGSDSKQTIIVEDHSVVNFNIDPKSGIDQNELTAAMAIVIKDNRQMIADTMAEAVKRKL